MLKWFIICFSLSMAFLAYEFWRAPLVDHNNKVVEPEKKLYDLFKRNNKKHGTNEKRKNNTQ